MCTQAGVLFASRNVDNIKKRRNQRRGNKNAMLRSLRGVHRLQVHDTHSIFFCFNDHYTCFNPPEYLYA